VPLSEHEQRLLEQMERALYADDPKFASSLRGGHQRGYDRRRLILGVVVLVAGMGLLLAGVAIPLWPLGVAGFVAMLLGAWLSLTGWRQRTAPAAAATDAGTAGAAQEQRKSRGGFMNRMEDRWQRRQDGEQGPGR
jgi:hypothetical protein